MLTLTKFLIQSLSPQSPKSCSNQSKLSSTCDSLVQYLNAWMLVWIGWEWSDRFTQHIHPWPCTKSKKSIASLVCKAACLTESALVSSPVKAREVALVCLASQQPHLFSNPKAFPMATPGAKNYASQHCPLDQKSSWSSQSLLNACKLHLTLQGYLCQKIIDV